MKANVQYNDFKGTTAADIGDSYSLTDFLKQKGVDTDRYRPIGSKFFSNYESLLSVDIICVDNQQSTDGEPYIVELSLNEPMTHKEYFGLFKRYECIVVQDYYQQYDIKDSKTIGSMEDDD